MPHLSKRILRWPYLLLLGFPIISFIQLNGSILVIIVPLGTSDSFHIFLGQIQLTLLVGL